MKILELKLGKVVWKLVIEIIGLIRFYTVRFCQIIYDMYILFILINEPVHEISNNVVCATSKASDQPAHMRSLIRAFSRRLSILWLLSYWLNNIWSF